jgi:uncharacterized Zn-finger protein
MPNRRKSSGQRDAPKLFRCSGYGNCDMVFTRSEHLARHERKHTGEVSYFFLMIYQLAYSLSLETL